MTEHWPVIWHRPSALRLATLAGVVVLASSCTASWTSESTGDATAPTTVAANARLACERYYLLDAFRRTDVVDARGKGERERRAVLREYGDLADALASAVDGAVTVQALPEAEATRSLRIARELRRLASAGGDVNDIVGPLAARLDRRLARLEAACVAAGVPLPAADSEIRDQGRGG